MKPKLQIDTDGWAELVLEKKRHPFSTITLEERKAEIIECLKKARKNKDTVPKSWRIIAAGNWLAVEDVIPGKFLQFEIVVQTPEFMKLKYLSHEDLTKN